MAVPDAASGNRPAQATAKSVIASAKRLMELRQDWFNSSRMAEIRVPACPIPIHQTKFVMANPHATGMLIPQMPTPFPARYVTATLKTRKSVTPIENMIHQKTGVLRESTMEPICSLTVSNVWLGVTTGKGLFGSGSRALVRCLSSTVMRRCLLSTARSDYATPPGRLCVGEYSAPHTWHN